MDVILTPQWPTHNSQNLDTYHSRPTPDPGRLPHQLQQHRHCTQYTPCLPPPRCWPRPDLRPTSLSYSDILCCSTELGATAGPGGPASGFEYTELWRPLPNSPDEYVVLEDLTDPMRFSCRWNQFFLLSTSGVSTLSCDNRRYLF